MALKVKEVQGTTHTVRDGTGCAAGASCANVCRARCSNSALKVLVRPLLLAQKLAVFDLDTNMYFGGDGFIDVSGIKFEGLDFTM